MCACYKSVVESLQELLLRPNNVKCRNDPSHDGIYLRRSANWQDQDDYQIKMSGPRMSAYKMAYNVEKAFLIIGDGWWRDQGRTGTQSGSPFLLNATVKYKRLLQSTYVDDIISGAMSQY